MDTPVLSVDKKQQNERPAANGATPAQAHSKKFTSWGQWLHYIAVGWVLDYFVNSGVGVTSSYISEGYKPVAEGFTQPVMQRMEKMLQPVLKGDAAKSGAKWAFRLFSIMAGGFAIIPFMIWLESKKNKLAIIRGLDNKIYGKEKVDNDPKFADSYRKIEEEPRKGFWAGMVARFIALTPILAGIVLFPKQLQKYVYDPIGNGVKWAEGLVHLRSKPIKWLNSNIETEEFLKEFSDAAKKIPNPHKSIDNFIHRIIGFDYGLTPIYAVLHMASFSAVAGLFHKWFGKKTPAAPEAAAAKDRDHQPAPAASKETMGATENNKTNESFEEKYGQKKTILPPKESYTSEEMAKAREPNYSQSP